MLFLINIEFLLLFLYEDRCEPLEAFIKVRLPAQVVLERAASLHINHRHAKASTMTQ